MTTAPKRDLAAAEAEYTRLVEEAEATRAAARRAARAAYNYVPARHAAYVAAIQRADREFERAREAAALERGRPRG
jgi:hypothetical protein